MKLLGRVTYSTDEVAEMTGLSTTAINKALRSGEIPATRVGHRWLIAAEWVEALRTKAPSPVVVTS